jgi:hypothetical protein
MKTLQHRKKFQIFLQILQEICTASGTGGVIAVLYKVHLIFQVCNSLRRWRFLGTCQIILGDPAWQKGRDTLSRETRDRHVNDQL